MSCETDLQDLYDTIMARMKGEQVQSAGHKGRSVTYADVPINSQIAMYNNLWANCGRASGLPRLQPVDKVQPQRGPAFKIRQTYAR